MHPENPYCATPPDFAALAHSYPGLKPFLIDRSDGTARVCIDFKNPEAIRQLSTALLKRDFNLDVSLPSDRLCPMVPGRLDYCLWIIDLLDLQDLELTDGKEVVGIDIGTGSSAIYPLLFSRLLSRVKMMATEIDQKSYESAQANISNNNLANQIELIRYTAKQSSIFPTAHILASPSRLAFTMCNPPFYSSREEMDELSLKKDTEPLATCTGSDTEMIISGGEVSFINQLIRDSLALKDHVRWFTSLCGKFSTLTEVVKTFKTLQGNNHALSELLQGQTRRWVFAWSWQDWRVRDALGRPSVESFRSTKNLLPLPNEIGYHLPSLVTTVSFTDLTARVSRILTSYPDLSWQMCPLKRGDDESVSWNVAALRKSWSRAERRKRKPSTQPTGERLPAKNASSQVLTDRECADRCPTESSSSGDPSPIMEVSLTLSCTPSNNEAGKHPKECSSKEAANDQTARAIQPLRTSDTVYRLDIRWLRGYERDVFESFWNHLIKKVIQCDGWCTGCHEKISLMTVQLDIDREHTTLSNFTQLFLCISKRNRGFCQI